MFGCQPPALPLPPSPLSPSSRRRPGSSSRSESLDSGCARTAPPHSSARPHDPRCRPPHGIADYRPARREQRFPHRLQPARLKQQIVVQQAKDFTARQTYPSIVRPGVAQIVTPKPDGSLRPDPEACVWACCDPCEVPGEIRIKSPTILALPPLELPLSAHDQEKAFPQPQATRYAPEHPHRA